ncbi:MAG: hypothetical protein ACT4OE_10360 [Sphingosinicella sp.]
MRPSLILASMLLAISSAASSQAPESPPFHTFADLADLALAAPVIAHVRIARATLLSPREAGPPPPGFRRFLFEAEAMALVRGAPDTPVRVSWLADLPVDGRGRAQPPRRRSEYLVLAAPVAGRPGELRLVARDSMVAFDPATAAIVREIVREVLAPDSPPRITGAGRAFHVTGSLPGESETQVFLETHDSRPVSLTVLRRPGEEPKWSVALGEMVDEAAATPRPETLLWYRLACFLPGSLPTSSIAEASAREAAAITRDYRLFLERLGPCRRQRVAVAD